MVCSPIGKHSAETTFAASAVQYPKAFQVPAGLKHGLVEQTLASGVSTFPGLFDPGR